MSTTNFMAKAAAVVMSAAGILGVAYGIAKYVNDFENAKAEIQNLRGQITQLHEVLAKTQWDDERQRLDEAERQIAELKQAMAAPPAAQAPKAVRDHLASGQFSGTASDGTSVWPFRVSSIMFAGDNEFEADLEWPTLKAVHRIKGRYSASSIFFKEMAFIKQGNNVLGCEYTLEKPSTEGLSGAYRNCDENASGGIVDLKWF